MIKNYLMTNYIICSLGQISCYYGGLVNENELGRACVRYGTDEKDIQIKVEKPAKRRSNTNPNVRRKMILKCRR